MTKGELINELIWSNIRVWHTATLIKSDNVGEMPYKEQGRIHVECRKHNAARSDSKSKLDLLVGDGFDDRKLNYLGVPDE